MISIIQKQIQNIQCALEWIKENEPKDYERQFLSLVEERRKLRKIELAEALNPAAAAYGESQKGKSYLMSNLLQKEGAPFLVHYGDKDYDFTCEMNPIGKGAESTGIVTRFTSFKRGGELYSEEHPIALRTLSVSDIVLIIADGYYNDMRNYSIPNDIKEKRDAFYHQYVSAPIVNGPVQADDLLEMESYFMKYINHAQEFCKGKAGYFQRLALIADRIPVSDYEAVYGFLWDNNEHFSRLFQRLLNLLERIEFAPYVYLPLEAMLHHDNNYNTIMAVQCLHGETPEAKAPTEVYVRKGKAFDTITNIPKCDLAAIGAEVVLKIPEDFLESEATYCTDGMSEEVRKKLLGKTVKRDILNNLDLLDFPGARSRIKMDKEGLGKGNNLTSVLLRGKVAYLFNKYNESSEINVLLFCHDQVKCEVTDLPILLDNWVNNYVGRTPDERQKKISVCGGIAPLFYVATKFNMDMVKEQPDGVTANALKGRWNQRFYKHLYNECLRADLYDWVKNWTATDEMFTNSYLLRDFKYSDRIYNGFEIGKGDKTNISKEEAFNENNGGGKPFYDALRESFIDSEDTARFFKNPALAWDVAATINNDGALFIIENLSVVAARMLEARTKQFREKMDEVHDKVETLMENYLPATGDAERLEKNKSNAYSVTRELDFACNEDNYYFGHLIEGLQLRENDIHDPIHNMITSGELNNPLNNFDKYQIIRKSCRNFVGCANQEEKWERYAKTYGFKSKEQAQKDLQTRNINVELLFADKLQPQLASYIIPEKVLELWKERITSVDFQNTYTADGKVAPSVMTELVSNLIDAVDRFDLLEPLHEDLKAYTDVAAIYEIPVPLVADIIASTVSNFVMDFGYSMLSEDKRQKLKENAEKEGWPVYCYVDVPTKAPSEMEDVALLFDKALSSGNALTPSFEEKFFSWKEYVFLSFMSRVERPKYTVEASRQLFDIVGNIKNEQK